jgi:hypothetical protein
MSHDEADAEEPREIGTNARRRITHDDEDEDEDEDAVFPLVSRQSLVSRQNPRAQAASSASSCGSVSPMPRNETREGSPSTSPSPRRQKFRKRGDRGDKDRGDKGGRELREQGQGQGRQQRARDDDNRSDDENHMHDLFSEEDNHGHDFDDDDDNNAHPQDDNILGVLAKLKAAGDGQEDAFSTEQLMDLLVGLHALWSMHVPHGASPFDEGVRRFWPTGDGPHVDSLLVKNVEEAFKLTVFQVLRLQWGFTRHGMIEAPVEPERRPRGTGAAADYPSRIAPNDLGGSSYSSRISDVLKAASHFRDLMISHLRLRRVLDTSFNAADPAPADPCRYTGFDASQLNERQSFIIYCLNELQAHGYRRYMKSCYQQRESALMDVLNEDQTPQLDEDGVQVQRRFPTHAWLREIELDKFVRQVAPKEDRFAQWLNMTKPGNYKETVEYLQTCADPEFPLLEPDRHWFACSDGLFHTRTGTFYPHGSNSPDIPPGMVACNYFDFPMHKMNKDGSGYTIDAAHWCVLRVAALPPCFSCCLIFSLHCRYDVETNAIQSILEYQLAHLQWDDGQLRTDGTLPDNSDRMHETIQWFYVLFGRLLFEVGEMDAWQVILFIVGRAGTGKSTLLDALAAFFQPEDVEILANKGRKGDGGLQTFIGKFMWMCREVKHDMSLDQADLQSMITGETMSISVLFNPSVTVTWKVPGVLAGNEAAAWTDNSGSISRRLIMGVFDRKVDPSCSDPRLKQKIKGEMPQFLYKCCIAYLSAVEEFGEKDLWGKHTIHTQECVAAAAASASSAADSVEHCECVAKNILPKFFHDNTKKLQAMTHPLVNFLRSSDAITTGTLAVDGMPWERLKELANAWILDNNANNGRGMKWDEDKYKSVLDNFDIKKIALTGGGRDYDGKMYPVRSQWLLGITESRFAKAAHAEHFVDGGPDGEPDDEQSQQDDNPEFAAPGRTAGQKRRAGENTRAAPRVVSDKRPRKSKHHDDDDDFEA